MILRVATTITVHPVHPHEDAPLLHFIVLLSSCPYRLCRENNEW